jgi:hypothetical protein
VSFHVFIEHPVDDTPAGRQRLAATIAERYRLPLAQVTQFLEKGRFRVKSNADETTARRYAADLQAIGAVVTVADAQSGRALSLGPTPATPTTPTTPTPSTPSARDSATPARAAAPRAAGTPPPEPVKPAPKFESGLAAAMAQTPAVDSLAGFERLGGGDGGGFSLASLDGNDEAFDGPVGLGAPAPAAKVIEPVPESAFMAPDEEEGEAAVLLADEAPAPRAGAAGATGTPSRPSAATAAKGGAAAPPAPGEQDGPRSMPSLAPMPDPGDELLDLASPVGAASGTIGRPGPGLGAGGGTAAGGAAATMAAAENPSLPAATSPPTPADAPARAAPRASRRARAPGVSPLAHYFGDRPRQRVLAGLALALLVGAIPATLYGANAEEKRLSAIRRDLVTMQASVTSLEQWTALDAPGGVRASALADMYRARTRVRNLAGFFWIVTGVAVGALWFKKLVPADE